MIKPTTLPLLYGLTNPKESLLLRLSSTGSDILRVLSPRNDRVVALVPKLALQKGQVLTGSDGVGIDDHLVTLAGSLQVRHVNVDRYARQAVVFGHQSVGGNHVHDGRGEAPVESPSPVQLFLGHLELGGALAVATADDF